MRGGRADGEGFHILAERGILRRRTSVICRRVARSIRPRSHTAPVVEFDTVDLEPDVAVMLDRAGMIDPLDASGQRADAVQIVGVGRNTGRSGAA